MRDPKTSPIHAPQPAPHFRMPRAPLIPTHDRRSAPDPAVTSSPGKRQRVRYQTRLDVVPELPSSERSALRDVTERYAYRSNDYYNALIDWHDPDDPIRRIVIPDRDELDPTGTLDASNEDANTAVPGLQHKYPHTALLLVKDVCGGYCRFCFRKRLFMNGNDEVVRDIGPGLDYIRRTPKITNVLLTGGDPLLLSTPKLERILSALREIRHVRIIRIGSKMPAFNPFRILDDPTLTSMLARHSRPRRRVYVMAHFNHPRELTPDAVLAVHELLRAGVVVTNQTPLLRGVNDSAEVLAELFRSLSFLGVPPYYLFQCRPTRGNAGFAVPLVEGYRHFEEAHRRVSGLAKRARYVMSHDLGKIEIVGVDRDKIYLKFHRARRPDDAGRFLVFTRDDSAAWLDELLAQTGGTLGGWTPAEAIGATGSGTRLRPRDRLDRRRRRSSATAPGR